MNVPMQPIHAQAGASVYKLVKLDELVSCVLAWALSVTKGRSRLGLERCARGRISVGELFAIILGVESD
jgi:hypothetical protein